MRVATIPFTDRYVDAVLPPAVARLGPSGEFSPWLDISYLTAHAAEIDVLVPGAFAAGPRPHGIPRRTEWVDLGPPRGSLRGFAEKEHGTRKQRRDRTAGSECSDSIVIANAAVIVSLEDDKPA